jgi:hypothetical protein
MRKKFSSSILYITFLFSICHSLPGFSQTISEKGMSPQEEKEFSKVLIEYTDLLLKAVNNVSESSFKGRKDISADVAFDLIKDARSTEASLSRLLKSLVIAPEAEPDVSALAWTVIAREMAFSYPHLVALSDAKLIEEPASFMWVFCIKVLDQAVIPKQKNLIK